MPHRRNDAVDDAMIERALRTRRIRLAFPRPLEQLFEAETGAARCRTMFWLGLVGALLYLLLLLTDYVLVPDVFPLAVALRVGVIGPLVAATLVMLRFNPPAVLREGVMTAVSVLAGLASLYLMLMSESVFRDGQHPEVVLLVLYLTLLQGIRFPYAVLGCLSLLAAYVAAVLALPEYAPERAAQSILVFSIVTVLALIGSWHLERTLREGYLLWLRERRAFSAMTDVSLRDPLTGLANRRALDRALAALEFADEDEDIAVVLVEIDHFNTYVDGLGRPAGDAALCRIAAALRKSLRRQSDAIYRLSGEEFLLLLPRTDLRAGVSLAERLRHVVEAENLRQADIPGKVLTASFGVAATKIGSEITFDELIAGADTALFAARRHGGNQVWPPIMASRAEQVLRMRRQAG